MSDLRELLEKARRANGKATIPAAAAMELLRDRHPFRDCRNPNDCPFMQDYGGQIVYMPITPKAKPEEPQG